MTDSECQNPRGTKAGTGGAYPDELREAERTLFKRGKGKSSCCPKVGLALSGGGIRSATFSFGVIQALARDNLLRQIHVLSTVSGGAYTGSLLTRLFSRKEIKDHDDVRRAILPEFRRQAEESSDNSHGEKASGSYSQTAGSNRSESSNNSCQIPTGEVARWLRDNGRYLAPNGGDLLLNGAILLRNWVFVHIVLATGALTIFVLMQVFRGFAHIRLPQILEAVAGHCMANIRSFASIERWLTCHLPFGNTWLWWSPWVVVPVVILLVAAILGCLYWVAPVRKNIDQSRHRLSSMLRTVLTVSGVLFALTLIDSLGQTIYTMWRTPGFSLTGELMAMLGILVAILAWARRVAAYVSGTRGAVRWPSLKLLAGVAAVALFATWLVILNAFAHAIAWQGDYPRHVLEKVVVTPVSATEANRSGNASDKSLARFECREHCPDLVEYQPFPTLGIAVVLMIVTFAIGRSRSFLNDSTLLPLYTARLTRAYLGASNKKRLCKDTPVAVTQVNEDDDTCIKWGWAAGGREDDPFVKGAPLHFTSVTINETLGGKVQLEQTGRKGIGMAVGPVGLSAGVRHHVVFKDEKKCQIFPKTGYSMFGHGDNTSEGDYTGQRLSFGQWVGISGAAFSTGLGRRTNTPFSLLAGFFNVRLGFWWDSGVDPRKRDKASKRTGFSAKCGELFTCVLPTYSYLLNELFGQFHGPARRHWCLTDGGHFDNTGAYELLRRRLPLIIVVDAEADPDCALDGLGNLVRKARADFNAEIEFVGAGELDRWREKEEDAGFLNYVGTLEELRCTKQGEDQCAGAGPSVQEKESRRFVHAAVAFVRYGATNRISGTTEPDSILVYIKPTLVGEEPADIVHYHAANPDFPHQTTADQFYDEAQWESYRKLGDLIAQRVIGGNALSLYCRRAQSGWGDQN